MFVLAYFRVFGFVSKVVKKQGFSGQFCGQGAHIFILAYNWRTFSVQNVCFLLAYNWRTFSGHFAYKLCVFCISRTIWRTIWRTFRGHVNTVTRAHMTQRFPHVLFESTNNRAASTTKCLNYFGTQAQAPSRPLETLGKFGVCPCSKCEHFCNIAQNIVHFLYWTRFLWFFVVLLHQRLQSRI